MKHQEIITAYKIAPKKALGQNFLVNEGILDSIAGIINITWKQVIEIGPGYGALTERLLKQAPTSLTLVEYDNEMVRILEDRVQIGTLPVLENTKCVISHTDVLNFSPECESIVVANIPYYITSPILFRFLYEVDFPPSNMVILMQREVGDKIRATKTYGHSYLSLAMENRCESIREEFRVAPGSFFPPPKVESSVLSFIVRKNPIIEPKKLLPILSAAFAHPRKKVISNLVERNIASKENLEIIFTNLGIRIDARAEMIGLDVWKDIIKNVET